MGALGTKRGPLQGKQATFSAERSLQPGFWSFEMGSYVTQDDLELLTLRPVTVGLQM